MAMLWELPPAAAKVRDWEVGWILICQVSEGGVSMTALVAPSARSQTLMKLSRELEAANVPLLSVVTEMTPRVCPAGCRQRSALCFPAQSERNSRRSSSN